MLSLTLLVPSVVKVFHVFENHKHEVCISYDLEHFHQFDIDCDFYKFKVSNDAYISIQYSQIDAHLKIQQILGFYNNPVIHRQQLSFSLRGPPVA